MNYQQEPFCQKVVVDEIAFSGPLAINAFASIQEIMKNCYQEGKKKLRQNLKQLIIMSFITGMQFCLGIHAALMIVTEMDSKTYEITDGKETLLYTTKHSYSYTRIIIAAFTPLGGILTSVIGGNLFVENLLYLTIGLINNSMKIGKILQNLGITYFVNLIAALFYSFILGYCTRQFHSPIIQEQLDYLTVKKLDLGFGYTMVNGIGGGVALGIAFLLSNGSKTVICKISSLWLPYVVLISIGFEHYIENFFSISCSFMYGIDGSIAKFLFLNIVPVSLGNIIGITGIIALTYSLMFFNKEEQKKLKCAMCDQYN